MKSSVSFHGFGVSAKGREKDWAFITIGWLGPIIAWLSVLAISVAVVGALLGER